MQGKTGVSIWYFDEQEMVKLNLDMYTLEVIGLVLALTSCYTALHFIKKMVIYLPCRSAKEVNIGFPFQCTIVE